MFASEATSPLPTCSTVCSALRRVDSAPIRTTASRLVGSPALGTRGASAIGAPRRAPVPGPEVNHTVATAAATTMPISANHLPAPFALAPELAVGCSTVGAKNCSAVDGAAAVTVAPAGANGAG